MLAILKTVVVAAAVFSFMAIPTFAANGTSRFRKIKRVNSPFRNKNDNVAAIDFGTTYCSVAFITKSDTSEESIAKLNLDPHNHTRVPTAVIFKDGKVYKFGFEARNHFTKLRPRDRMQYVYFEQIKMNLQHDEVSTLQ